MYTERLHGQCARNVSVKNVSGKSECAKCVREERAKCARINSRASTRIVRLKCARGIRIKTADELRGKCPSNCAQIVWGKYAGSAHQPRPRKMRARSCGKRAQTACKTSPIGALEVTPERVRAKYRQRLDRKRVGNVPGTCPQIAAEVRRK